MQKKSGDNMQNEELLEYFENVLGVKEVLLPKQESKLQAAESHHLPLNPTSPCRVLFVFQSATGQNDLSDQAQQLFEKMRAAMGLNATNTELLFLPLDQDIVSVWKQRMEQTPSLWSVSFSEPLSQRLIRMNPALALRLKTTHDPRLLLEKPDFKRATWTDLQEVMREI